MTFQGLAFDVDGRSGVAAAGAYEQVDVDDCSFDLGSFTGVFALPGSVEGARVRVENSAFTQGAPNVEVPTSTFSDHSHSGSSSRSAAPG